MSELFKADNINRHNEWAGVKAQNPLVGFIGFQYPQHFTRLFKKEVGCTPNEYRMQIC